MDYHDDIIEESKRHKISLKRERVLNMVGKLPLALLILMTLAILIPTSIRINENSLKDKVLTDARAIEQATRLVCYGRTCENGEEIKYEDVSKYLDKFEEDYYDLSSNNGVIAVFYYSDFPGTTYVYLEASGIGSWELTQGVTPTKVTIDSVIIDVD